MIEKQKEFMQKAIELSVKSVDNGGGPFGAVIVRDGEVIAESSNSVTKDNDPTAHAEINVIRMATKKIGNFDLAGCEVYSSCEPCPMCLGAIYWARLDKLYFANNKEDAKSIGFDDSFIYDEIDLSTDLRKLKTVQFMRNEALEAFEKWSEKEEKIEY